MNLASPKKGSVCQFEPILLSSYDGDCHDASSFFAFTLSFPQPLAIMDGPTVSSGTQERKKGARDQLTSEIEAAFGAYMKALDDIAVKHGRCVFMSQLIGCA